MNDISVVLFDYHHQELKKFIWEMQIQNEKRTKVITFQKQCYFYAIMISEKCYWWNWKFVFKYKFIHFKGIILEFVKNPWNQRIVHKSITFSSNNWPFLSLIENNFFRLGKTVQIISLLYGLFDLHKIKTVLIIMPFSLIADWETEFKKW